MTLSFAGALPEIDVLLIRSTNTVSLASMAAASTVKSQLVQSISVLTLSWTK